MRIAGVQMDVVLQNPQRNLARIASGLAETTKQGAELTVFPECAVPGYCFSSLEEALPFAETIPGPATESVTKVCRELGAHALFGMLERDGSRVFNAAVLVGPTGVVGSYRKVHLPYLGIDMFTSYGDRPFAVHSAGDLRVGMLICYDAAFPEASRSLALLGADLIALPTNWPPGAEIMSSCSIPCRAMENQVYFAAVNRVGEERGFPFIGESSICAPNGKFISRAQGTDEAILYADVDPMIARQKRIVRVPHKHVIDRLGDRRPELYGVLTQPHNHPTPREDYNRK